MTQTDVSQNLFFSEHELDVLLFLIAESYQKYLPGLVIGRQKFVVSEIVATVERSLNKKYPAHEKGYSAEKLAGAYTFWIAKLKPLYVAAGEGVKINEVAAIATGAIILKKLCKKDIVFDKKRHTDLQNMLRYHTTSPHSLTSLFTCYV